MRVMVLVKASKDSEAGVMPSEQLLTEMGKYNDELIKAGIMLGGEGLHPSSRGVRVRFSGKNRTVIDGPFAETKELVAGYWIWQVKSMEDAIAWLKRCPNPMMEESEVEIRRIFTAEDFGPAMTPELKAQEERQIADLKRAAVKRVPDGFHRVTPHLTVRDVPAMIEFYKKAFGAVQRGSCGTGPDGKVLHSEIVISDSIVFLNDEFPEMGAVSPLATKGTAVTIHLYVEDADAAWAQALAAGAEVVMPLADQFWGDRYGIVKDPSGHQWSIASHLEDLTPAEIKERITKMFRSQPCT